MKSVSVEEEEVVVTMERRVPQGSILSLLLWNVVYDSFLARRHLASAEIVSYADDLALVMAAKTVTEVKRLVEKVLLGLAEWLKLKGLSMSPNKTFMIQVTGRRRIPGVSVKLKDIEVTPLPKEKYLGVWIDRTRRLTT